MSRLIVRHIKRRPTKEDPTSVVHTSSLSVGHHFVTSMSHYLYYLAYLIIIILYIERHIQQVVRGALQHCKSALSVIINIQVNYFLKIMIT